MARTLTIYHPNGDKTQFHREDGYNLGEPLPVSRHADGSNLRQDQRVLRGYYDLECQQKLRPGKNYNRIKSIWTNDGFRRDAGLGD